MHTTRSTIHASLLFLWLASATLAASPAEEWKSQLKLTDQHLYSWLTSDASKLCMILNGGHLVVADMASGRATYDVLFQPYRHLRPEVNPTFYYCSFRGITYSRSGDTIVYVTPDHARPSEPFTLVFLDARASREFRRINLTQTHPLLRSGYRVFSIEWQHRRAVVVVFRKEDNPDIQSPMEVLVRYDLNTGVLTTIAGDDAVVLDEKGDKWFEKHVIPSAPSARRWRVYERQFPYIICTNGDSTKVLDERTNEVQWQSAGRALGFMDGYVHIVNSDTTVNRHDITNGTVTTTFQTAHEPKNPYQGFNTYLARPIGNCENTYSYFSNFDGPAEISGRFIANWDMRSILDLHTSKVHQSPLFATISSVSSTGHLVFSFRNGDDTARFLILDTVYSTFKDFEILGRVDKIVEMPRTHVVHLATKVHPQVISGPATGHIYALDSTIQTSFGYWETYVRIVKGQPNAWLEVRIDDVLTFTGETESYLQASTCTNSNNFHPPWKPLLFTSTDTVSGFSWLSFTSSYGNDYSTLISNDRSRIYKPYYGTTHVSSSINPVDFCSAKVRGLLRAIPTTPNALVGNRHLINGTNCRLDSLAESHAFTVARSHAIAMARQGSTTLILDLRQPRFATTATLHTPNVVTQTFAFADTQLQSIDSTGTLTVFEVGGTELRRVPLPGWMPRWDTLAWSADGSVITQAHQRTGYIKTWNTFGELLRELRYPTKVESRTHITAETGKVFIVPHGNGAMYWTSGFDPKILSVSNTNRHDFDAHTSGTAAGSYPSTEYYTLLGQRIEHHDLANHRTYIEVHRTHAGVQSTLRVKW